MVENLKMMILLCFVMSLELIIIFLPQKHLNKMVWLKEKNRTLEEITCTMLSENNLPRYFFAEAVFIVCYVVKPCHD